MTDAQVNAVVDSVVQQLRELGVTAFFVGARTPEGAFTSAFGKPDEVVFMLETLKLEVVGQNEIMDSDLGLGRLV